MASEKELYSQLFKFETSPGADSISMIAFGSHASGTVTVSQRSSPSNSKEIRTSVQLTWSEAYAETMKLCTVEELDDGGRIEIKTPTFDDPEDTTPRVNIRITVSFPANKQYAKSLSLRLPHFACAFKGAIYIKNISVQKLRSITIEESAHCSRFQGTSSGDIVGRLVAKTALTLKAAHGNITVDAKFREHKNLRKHTKNGVSLRLQSQTGKISAVLSSHSRASPYRVDVEASTSQQPVEINLDDMSGEPELHLTASTGNGLVAVMLPRHYLGEFFLRSEGLNQTPSVQLRHADDVSLQVQSSREGEVSKSWGTVGMRSVDGLGMGRVEVTAGNGCARLVI